jgi:hypothetical protein
MGGLDKSDDLDKFSEVSHPTYQWQYVSDRSLLDLVVIGGQWNADGLVDEIGWVGILFAGVGELGGIEPVFVGAVINRDRPDRLRGCRRPVRYRQRWS